MTTLTELLQRWDSNEGKPYKGSLIDWSTYLDFSKSDDVEPPLSCMCAQGQVLHFVAGWSPEQLHNAEQDEADREVAKRLNISIAHSILLRSVNDKMDGAPSIVLTNPEKVLGDQAHILLAFWLHLDNMSATDWKKVSAAGAAAWDAAGAAAWDAARNAAGAAARDAAGAAARDAAWDAARDAAWAAAEACSEIQGARLMRERGKPFFFLPMFGIAAEPEAILTLPVDYGVPR